MLFELYCVCLRLIPIFIVQSSPAFGACRDIANFLRIYKKDLDPLSIGDFLSEPDVDDVSLDDIVNSSVRMI